MPHATGRDDTGGPLDGGGGGAASFAGRAGAAVATFGISEGLRGISKGISRHFRRKDEKRQALEHERNSLLNSTNDYEAFLAKDQVRNPSRQIDSFIQSQIDAQIAGGRRGTGIDFGDGLNPKVTGIKSGAERLASDPVLASIVATLKDPGKSNLRHNEQTGLLDFVKPNLDLAVSKNFSGAKQNKFVQGGVGKSFGGAPKNRVAVKTSSLTPPPIPAPRRKNKFEDDLR